MRQSLSHKPRRLRGSRSSRKRPSRTGRSGLLASAARKPFPGFRGFARVLRAWPVILRHPGQCRLSQLPGNKTAAPVSSCNRALRIKVVAAGSRQGLKGKLLEKCNSPAISGLRFRKQAESFPFENYKRGSLGETRLVRTHGTGKIFTALVLREN